MEINLNNESRIGDIKDAFHRKFPFLKLEFFNPLAEEHERFHVRNVVTDESRTLEEIAGLHKPGYVRINEDSTVDEVEHCFRHCFGLFAQVFRKSGNTWLQTTGTDHRTLAEQNREGEEKNTPFNETPDQEDIHEQP